MHFQQLNYTSEPKAAVFARIGRKNRDCRGGSVADGAIGLRIVTFRFFDLFRNHPLPFRARIPLLLRDTPFRGSISPLTAAVHKMLIGFPCERLRRLQKHYICIQRMTVPCRRVMRRRDEKGTPVQFRDYPRSCNFHDKGRTISATAASGRREGVPAGTSQKTCRPPFVRSFRVEEPDDAICPAGIICPYRRGRCRIAFIPATPQPKSPFPTVTGHGASVRAGSAAEDDSTGIVAMKGGEETLRNASPTGFHADARPKISHPLPSDACQL